MCRRTEEEVGPTVGLPMPKTFHRVLKSARPSTDTGPPFLYGDFDTPPQLILFSSFRREVQNVSANQRPGRPSNFSDRPEKHKLGRGRWDLAFCQVWLNSQFSSFRGEVENVSANQRPGWPFCFSDRSKKHKLGKRRWDLASYQVSLNSVRRFQRRSRKSLSQSEARTAISFFQSARKTQTW